MPLSSSPHVFNKNYSICNKFILHEKILSCLTLYLFSYIITCLYLVQFLSVRPIDTRCLLLLSYYSIFILIIILPLLQILFQILFVFQVLCIKLYEAAYNKSMNCIFSLFASSNLLLIDVCY